MNRILLLLICCCTLASGQTTFRGTISDAQSGTLLAAANIQIDGTYRGTITNDQGEYLIEIDQLPATLIISYIGYHTQRHPLTAGSAIRQDITLKPAVYELAAITVR